MHYQYVFIMTYGRSGSTLLQGLLNSIDGVCIRGENNLILRPLYVAYHLAARAAACTDATDPTHPWFGAHEIEADALGRDLAEVFLRRVLRPYDGVKTIGFKEIRWGYVPDEHWEGLLGFIRRLFPGLALVVNTRELAATVASNVNAGHATTADEIAAFDRRLRELAGRGDPDVFHVHYDDYKDDPGCLKGLFDFLGAPFDRERLAAVVSTKHSAWSNRGVSSLGCSLARPRPLQIDHSA